MPPILPASHAEGRASTAPPSARRGSILFGNRTNQREIQVCSGRSPGGGNGNQLQCSCLDNPMDGEAGGVRVPGVAQSWTRLSTFCTVLD